MIRRPPRSTLFPYTNALPICTTRRIPRAGRTDQIPTRSGLRRQKRASASTGETRRRFPGHRSEEHTSELQSQSNLVCRLLLEKKKTSNLLYPITAIPDLLVPA